MPPESQSEAIVIDQSYIKLGAGREPVRDGSATFEANLMKASRCVAAFVMAILASACSQAPKGVDPNRVLAAPSPWPTPEVLAPNAPPRILGLWMSETTIHVGRAWNGRIITSTNVASVELRTESFSFVADRLGFGIFAFSQMVLDIIPQYRRAYLLRVIARNARGDAAEDLVPIVIR